MNLVTGLLDDLDMDPVELMNELGNNLDVQIEETSEEESDVEEEDESGHSTGGMFYSEQSQNAEEVVVEDVLKTRLEEKGI